MQSRARGSCLRSAGWNSALQQIGNLRYFHSVRRTEAREKILRIVVLPPRNLCFTLPHQAGSR
jgi:hypothetical protein